MLIKHYTNVMFIFYICNMNSKNLLTQRKKSPYKMDPNSDRYRKCPNDGVEFMAEHRSEKFCCAKCADEFHNDLKKKEAEEKKLVEEAKAIIANPILPQPQVQTEAPMDKAKQNVKIIDTLTIDPARGSVFNIDWLYSLGIDLAAYNGRGMLHNIDSSHNCHFLQIGNYRLFRVEFSEVLIKKII